MHNLSGALAKSVEEGKDPLAAVGLQLLMSISSGRKDVVVALIDGPILRSHPAFAGTNIREISNQHPAACSWVNSSACSHGTFVAGILASQRGLDAPAICPDCTFIVRPIFPETSRADVAELSAGPEELADAIVETVDAGTHIINLSLGLSQPSIGRQQHVEYALDYARARGVLVVAAAGNQGALGSTAITRHPWVIPVVAADILGRPSIQSNLSGSIGRNGLAAPGYGVISLATGGGSIVLGGTSVAAPFVTGTAALLWSVFPRASASQVMIAVTQKGTNRRRSILPRLLNAAAAFQLLSEEMR